MTFSLSDIPVQVAWVIMGACAASVVAIGVVLTILVLEPAATTPIEVFEAHALALDEGRYDDAEVLLNCRQAPHTQLRADSEQLEQYGGFTGTYPVTGEWVHSGGDNVILDLDAPEGFPTIQSMVKVDGEWKLQCGNE